MIASRTGPSGHAHRALLRTVTVLLGVAASASLGLAACGDKGEAVAPTLAQSSVVGRWTATGFNGRAFPVTVDSISPTTWQRITGSVMTLEAPNRARIETNFVYTAAGDLRTVSIQDEGAYSLSGGVLEITFTNAGARMRGSVRGARADLRVEPGGAVWTWARE